MPIDNKTVADSALNLTDSIIKLSTALLLIPMVFLKFVAELGPKAHPEALQGFYPVSNYLKLGIFVPLGLSILTGLVTKYAIVHKLSQEAIMSGGKLARSIMILVSISGVFFVVGMTFLVYLFFQFPIEIPEPFRFDRTPLG